MKGIVTESPSHLTTLAATMQTDFQPGLTHFAVTDGGHCINGGHSGASFIAAFLPPEFAAGCQLQVKYVNTKDEEGEPIKRIVGAPFPVSYVDEDEVGLHSVPFLHEPTPVTSEDPTINYDWEEWDEEAWLDSYATHVDAVFGNRPRQCEIQIVVNCQPTLLQKFDDVARGRQGAEQLEMNSGTRALIENSHCLQSFKFAETVLKSCFLRSSSKTDENGNTILGDAKRRWKHPENQVPRICLRMGTRNLSIGR